MFSMRRSTIEQATIPESSPRHRNWFRITVLTCLVAIVVSVFVVAGIQIKQVRHLKAAARRVKLGDAPRDVYSILGEPKLGYEAGWPSPGAPPTEYGELYGGRLDYLRDDLASFANAKLAGVTSYSFSRSIRSWPVLVQYNSSKRVSAVYIDCIKVK